MKLIATLVFFVGLSLSISSFYVIDAYGVTRGSLQFLAKMVLVTGMLIGGVAVMCIANKLAKQKQ